jgi:hypothetical protein
VTNTTTSGHFWEQLPGGLQRIRIRGGWIWKDPSSGSLAFVPYHAVTSDTFNWPPEPDET